MEASTESSKSVTSKHDNGKDFSAKPKLPPSMSFSMETKSGSSSTTTTAGDPELQGRGGGRMMRKARSETHVGGTTESTKSNRSSRSRTLFKKNKSEHTLRDGVGVGGGNKSSRNSSSSSNNSSGCWLTGRNQLESKRNLKPNSSSSSNSSSSNGTSSTSSSNRRQMMLMRKSKSENHVNGQGKSLTSKRRGTSRTTTTSLSSSSSLNMMKSKSESNIGPISVAEEKKGESGSDGGGSGGNNNRMNVINTFRRWIEKFEQDGREYKRQRGEQFQFGGGTTQKRRLSRINEIVATSDDDDRKAKGDHKDDDGDHHQLHHHHHHHHREKSPTRYNILERVDLTFQKFECIGRSIKQERLVDDDAILDSLRKVLTGSTREEVKRKERQRTPDPEVTQLMQIYKEKPRLQRTTIRTKKKSIAVTPAFYENRRPCRAEF